MSAASGSLGARTDQRARELVQAVLLGLAIEDSATSLLASEPRRRYAPRAAQRLDEADVALHRIARALDREGRLGAIVHAAIAARNNGLLQQAELADLADAVDNLEEWAQPRQRVLAEAAPDA